MISTTIAKRFDRAAAEATLPLVRRIVVDIQGDNERLQALLPELKAARKRSRELGALVPELGVLRQRVADITTSFERYLAELAQIGCVYRGATGHVDFRGDMEGRPIFFCWAPADEGISHVHLLGSACRHREPIGVGVALPLAGHRA